MIDSNNLVKAFADGDFGVWEKALEDANALMTAAERKIFRSFTSSNLKKRVRRKMGIADRPMGLTPFEMNVKDNALLYAYRICLAKCWVERDEADTDGTIAGIKAVDMMIEAGLIKMEDLK